MILGFHHKLDEICALLGNYAVFSGTLQAFSGHRIGLFQKGHTGCPETLAKNCHYTALHNFPEECRSLIINAPILSSKCVVTIQMFLKNWRIQLGSVWGIFRKLPHFLPHTFYLSDITNIFFNIVSLLVSKLCPLVYKTFKGLFACV